MFIAARPPARTFSGRQVPVAARSFRLVPMSKSRWVAPFALGVLLGAAPAAAQDRPNLRAESVQGPLEAVSGSEITVEARISSLGSVAAGSFRYRVLLTPNGAVSAGVPLATSGPVSLQPGQTQTFSLAATIPANVSGRFVLALEVDPSDQVDEGNELDNTRAASDDLRVRAPMASLVATQPVLETSEGRVGDAVSFRVRVTNQGEIAATVPVAVYLRPAGSRTDAQSAAPIVSRADPELARDTVTVGPGQQVQVQLSGAVPTGLAVGDYVVGAFVDPEGSVSETVILDNLAVASARLNVYEDTLEFVTNALPDAAQFVGYYVRLQARGGDGRYLYRLVQSTLPDGLSLSLSGETAGVLSGTPRRSGGYPLQLEVSSRGMTVRRSLQLNVQESPIELTIVTPGMPDGTVSLNYDIPLAAAGGEPPYSWSVSGGRLPPGLDISSDGRISGIPLSDGQFTVEITVKDAEGASVTKVYTLSVEAPNVVILTGRLPALPLSEAIRIPVIASGGQEPYGWTALSDPPPGLELTEDGHLSGTPTRVGHFAFRVQVMDSSEARSADTALLQISVTDAGPFEFTTQLLDPGPVRVEYVREIKLEGGIEPITWRFAPGDGLPSGFSLETEGRVATIRGSSVRSVAHGFTLRATDASGRQREGTFAIRIDQFLVVPGTGGGCSALGGAEGGAPLALLFGLLLVLRRRRR